MIKRSTLSNNKNPTHKLVLRRWGKRPEQHLTILKKKMKIKYAVTKPDNTSSKSKASPLPVFTAYVCRSQIYIWVPIKQFDSVFGQTRQKMKILHCTFAKRIDDSSVRKLYTFHAHFTL